MLIRIAIGKGTLEKEEFSAEKKKNKEGLKGFLQKGVDELRLDLNKTIKKKKE
ncbi:MAG: hypothetical protein LBI53_00850 [Candidatus Peribacteria bacterium]|nr:hypothetical protein [Candidatus Peribacteria bacterium]